MTLTLYRTTSPSNALTKTLTGATQVTGTLKEQNLDVTNFQMRVKLPNSNSDIPTYNYAYIPEFDRYYWITPVTGDFAGGLLYKFESDPLMSFAAQIKNCHILPNRVEDGNAYVLDELVRTQVNREVTYQQYPTTPFVGQTPILIVQGPNGTIWPD